MVDIHNHLIYNVDDGSKSIEESLNIIKGLYCIGVTDLIITPHYIYQTKYNSSRSNNLKKLEELKKVLKKENININLYLGNEIYIDNELDKILEYGDISSLNNSKYLLIELPLGREYPDYLDIFKNLIDKGYKVILAHPERYSIVSSDFNVIYDLKNIGVLFQTNLGSSIKEYGKDSKKILKRLLKEDLVFCVGSDIHHETNYKKYLKAIKKYIKYSKNKNIFEKFNKNSLDIINNK